VMRSSSRSYIPEFDQLRGLAGEPCVLLSLGAEPLKAPASNSSTRMAEGPAYACASDKGKKPSRVLAHINYKQAGQGSHGSLNEGAGRRAIPWPRLVDYCGRKCLK
jgi:hypothetical protein